MASTLSAIFVKRRSFLYRVCLVLSFLLLSLAFFSGSAPHVYSAHTTPQQYNEFWAQQTTSDFGAWSFNGVSVQPGSHTAQVQLAAGGTLTCSATDIDGGAARFDTATGLCLGTDPMVADSYNGGNYYNGGSFSYGTLTSPIHTTQKVFTTLVASWNATTPAGYLDGSTCARTGASGLDPLV